MIFDVVIIGGGPAGATAATLLKKYLPDLAVAVFERERFPRDHVGESLLPLVNEFLAEMEVWDQVEAANFPIKIGATYRWGATPTLWNFEFLPNAEFDSTPRPSRLEGQRTSTAFQVDRSVFDQILLERAKQVGAEVFEQTRIVRVDRHGDRVLGCVARSIDGLEFGVSARYYLDCSGTAGILRRTMDVKVESPTLLRNLAIWDYWRNSEWAVEIGVGGTRIQVLSLSYGWLWFIPLGPDRTSVGLVVPAQYLKQSGLRPEDLYLSAVRSEPRIAQLLTNAQRENRMETTNDWSFIAERLAGENWLLAGDSCGFADPILSAGVTLAQASGREAAYVILESDKGEIDSCWLKQSFEKTHRKRILQHIRFADYWYSANSQFGDLVSYCSEIAKDSGLDLSPDQAFRWLGTGGFANDDIGQPSVGAYSITAVKRITQLFSGKDATWKLNQLNKIDLNLRQASIKPHPVYSDGRIYQVKALIRGPKLLPLIGPFKLVYDTLLKKSDLRDIAIALRATVPQDPAIRESAYFGCLMALEAMLEEGWAEGSIVHDRPIGLGLPMSRESATIRFDTSPTKSSSPHTHETIR